MEHFRNAPVPDEEEGPDAFDIEVDDRSMASIVQVHHDGRLDEKQVLNWVHLNTVARMRPDLLGQITLLYEKIVYHSNSVSTPTARKILRLHDLYIDADKQGYFLSDPAFYNFKKQKNLLKYDSMDGPAHGRFVRGIQAPRRPLRGPFPKRAYNITDVIFYDVVGPALDKALERA